MSKLHAAGLLVLADQVTGSAALIVSVNPVDSSDCAVVILQRCAADISLCHIGHAMATAASVRRAMSSTMLLQRWLVIVACLRLLSGLCL